MKTEKRLKIGINGFGRIGRAIFRRNLHENKFDVVVINELNDELDSIAYSLKYDSLHGILDEDIQATEDGIELDNQQIRTFSERAIEDVPWNDYDVDVIIGCTGSLANVDNAKKCLGKSVKKVVFSDSPANVDLTIVMGVNDGEYDHENHDVIAASICDVVGTAPVIKLLDEKFGVESGYFLTLHPWLFYQNLLDGKPSSPAYKDHPGTYLAMGRASANTLIPKRTSIVPALERIFPQIKGKTQGMSFRVPTDLVSSAYVSLQLGTDTTSEEVKTLIQDAVKEPVLGYTEEPLVSTDYRHHKYSAVVDGKWIEVLDNRNLRLISWYDNEWGYSANVLNIVSHIAEKF
jgi:glyceraldehyde 3-phosphate dehydrogenase